VIAPAVAVQDLALGEIIAFRKPGAYQEASAASFNGLPCLATVAVCGTTADVRRRETIEDVLGRDVIPERCCTRDAEELVQRPDAGPA
jgi:hypothetical protein